MKIKKSDLDWILDCAMVGIEDHYAEGAKSRVDMTQLVKKIRKEVKVILGSSDNSYETVSIENCESQESDTMQMKVKKLHEDAIIPEYAHESGDSGMDVFSVDPVYISVGERVLVKTGISVEVPVGYEVQVRPKSGLALKQGVTVLNTPGTVDANYRGELGVILINHGSIDVVLEKGKKIAQIVVTKVERAEIEVVEELSDTERGEGGFGSTGLEAKK